MPTSSAWLIGSDSTHGIDRQSTRRVAVCYSASGLAYTLAAWSSWTLRVGVFCALHPVMQWLLLLLTLGFLLMLGATVIVLITEQRRRRSIEARRRAILPSSFTDLAILDRNGVVEDCSDRCPGIRLSRPCVRLGREQRQRRQQAA